MTEITKILSNESSVESSSNRGEEGEEIASVNVGEAGDTQESDNDTESDSQKTESSNPETTATFHSENPCEHCQNSNVYGALIMKCPKCSWHDYYKFCPMRYVITRSPREKLDQIIFGVTTVEKNTKTRIRWKPIFILLLKRITKEMTDL